MDLFACVLVVALLLAQPLTSFGYVISRPHRHAAASSSLWMSLQTGDFENVKFSKLSTSPSGPSRFGLSAVITKADMNSFLNEYKEEMKRRKVVFPGFRAGKLPPYVMGDVRKYLVCFGLETMLGQLCNLNKLQMCSEEGGEVAFGEDKYYDEIIQKDFRGFDFAKQRDSWREGTDFSFACEFWALSEEEEEEKEEGGGDKAVVAGKVVDTEEVKTA
jgi:hypothetical protein